MAKSNKISDKENSDSTSSEVTQDTFADLFQDLITKLAGHSANEQPIAVLLIKTKPNEPPKIYSNGHPYEMATILASVLRPLKSRILEELET